MKEIAFQFEKVNMENLDRFSEMYLLCLNAKVDKRYFQWKYLDNPSGKVQAFEAKHENNIAGFYGVIPETYHYRNKLYKVFQSMDTMTHPSYQKKGLFTKLAKLTYDDLVRNNENTFISGIPGSQSFYGFVNKLNWKHVHSFKYTFINKFIFRLKNFLTNTSSITVVKATEIDSEFDLFLDEYYASSNKIALRISGAYLQWKCMGHPAKKYEVVKLKVNNKLEGISLFTIESGNKCKIELTLLSQTILKQPCITSLCNYIFRNHNINVIYTWSSLDDATQNKYKSTGFLINPFDKGVFSYRVPLIFYMPNPFSAEVNWLEPANFDFQPFMQD